MSEREQLEQAIAALEAQRATLGNAVIDAALGSMRKQLAELEQAEAVNLASRLEDASERGEIFVGPDTYRLTAPLFEFEEREPIAVKGKVGRVQVYRLLRAKPGRGKGRGIEGLDSPMVGREDEVQALQEAVEHLQAGVGGVVTVIATFLLHSANA